MIAIALKIAFLQYVIDDYHTIIQANTGIVVQPLPVCPDCLLKLGDLPTDIHGIGFKQLNKVSYSICVGG